MQRDIADVNVSNTVNQFRRFCGSDTSKFAIPRWLGWLPLQQCKHYTVL